MDGLKASAADIGMRLVVDGKRTLTLGEKNLEISGSSASKASRNSCAPFSPAPESESSIPFYNILWAEAANGTITIDYALQTSATSIERKQHSFPTVAGDGAPAGQPDPETFAAVVLTRAYGDSIRQKRAYVLINPNSGPGGAVRQWQNEVKPLFDAARLVMDVVTLKKGGEATDLAEQVDIDKYDTIMACSGDGTPHEIFNGLAKRPDARGALEKIAVSHIPCGSGNAMSCNLYGSYRPAFAALAIIKGVVTPVDLVSITQGEKRYVSFLTQALGIMAEADLMTEDMRWMGSKRFEVGLLKRVFQRKCFPCDLAVRVVAGDKGAVREHYRRQAGGGPGVAGQGGLEGADAQAEVVEYEGNGLPPLKFGTVQDKLPEGWELVRHDKIGTFYCGNMAYVAPKANFFPASVPSDGCMDLVTIDGSLSPFTAAKVLMAVETRDFFDNPHVSYRKISAYRIIPREQESGCISMDGERVPFEPFQAEVHQGLGRVITKRGVFEAEGPIGWEKGARIESM